MKAVLCKAFGPPGDLVVEDVPSPDLGEGQVRVAVHACGVNFPDTLIIAGKYQLRPPFPFTPGGEAAGEVVEAGPGVTGFKPGDRVIRLGGWGGYAEELVAPESELTALPDFMDFVTAAGFSIVYGTSWHGLVQRAQLKAGETLLVLGAAGGVGLTAVELGNELGATVIAAASSADKLELAREYGAAHLINYSKEDLRARVKEITGGKGADVVYDPVGGELLTQALRSLGKRGRYLVIGFAGGLPEVPANLVLLKELDLLGVYWGDFAKREPEVNRANFATMFDLYKQGRIKPHVSRTLPLESAAEAMTDLLERRAKGKIVLTTGAG